MQFNKVDISGANDQNCDIETFINLTGNQGYRLAQKGFNSTTINESWQVSDGWFDSTLVEFDTTTDPDKVIVNFKTHEMNEICTYNPDTETYIILSM